MAYVSRIAHFVFEIAVTAGLAILAGIIFVAGSVKAADTPAGLYGAGQLETQIIYYSKQPRRLGEANS